MTGEDRGLNFGAGGGDSGVRKLGVLVALVFAIALAIVVGKRMSADAMAVVVGVVCGVAASVPTSVLLLLATTGREHPRETDLGHAHRGKQYPPVVVIQGGSQQALSPGSQLGYWPLTQAGPTAEREFHVVGGEDLLERW